MRVFAFVLALPLACLTACVTPTETPVEHAPVAVSGTRPSSGSAATAEHPTAAPTTDAAALPKDLTPLHLAVIAGEPDRIFEQRQAGADLDARAAGWTAIDLAFTASARANDPDNWQHDSTPAQLAMILACPQDARQLEEIIDALTRRLPADTDSIQLIDAWYAAAATGDLATANKLGTPAWVQEERDSKHSFSRAIFQDGIRVQAYEILGAETEGDLTTIAVKTTLLRPDGSTDGEPMNFTLQRVDGELLIVKLQ